MRDAIRVFAKRPDSLIKGAALAFLAYNVFHYPTIAKDDYIDSAQT